MVHGMIARGQLVHGMIARGQLVHGCYGTVDPWYC